MRGALAMGRLWPEVEVEVEVGASKAARLLVVAGHWVAHCIFERVDRRRRRALCLCLRTRHAVNVNAPAAAADIL